MPVSPQDAGGSPAREGTLASTGDDKSQVKAEESKTDATAAPADTQDGTDTTDGEPRPKKADGGFQRRINRLTAEKRLAEQQAAELKAQLDQVRQPPQMPEFKSALKEPRLADFASYEEYERAERDYTAQLAEERVLNRIRSESERRHREETERQQAERMHNAGAKFRAEIEKAAERYEDIHDAVDALFSGDIPSNNAMAEYVVEMADDKAALAHHLYSNPEIAERISKLSPSATVRELTRLEATLNKLEVRTETNAPPPPKTVKARGSGAERDPEKMTIDEMRAATGTRRKVNY